MSQMPVAYAEQIDPEGIAEWLRQRALRAPERPDLTFEGTTCSYGEFQTRIGRMAAMLAARGVGPRDRVAILMFNHPAVLVALFAVY